MTIGDGDRADLTRPSDQSAANPRPSKAATPGTPTDEARCSTLALAARPPAHRNGSWTWMRAWSAHGRTVIRQRWAGNLALDDSLGIAVGPRSICPLRRHSVRSGRCSSMPRRGRDHDKNPVDLTEAYLQFRPYPVARGYRFRLKAGAFYAPISLENRSAGWESPYTLSYSAINTWFGAGVRTIGAEGQIDWLGTRTRHAFDLALTGGVFGWNDPAGVVIADRGFRSSDRQTTLFGQVGAQLTQAFAAGMSCFSEIDHRAGFYTGVEARYFDRVVVRALHYDNRGDPAAFDAATGNFAWDTHFNAVGIRVEERKSGGRPSFSTSMARQHRASRGTTRGLALQGPLRAGVPGNGPSWADQPPLRLIRGEQRIRSKAEAHNMAMPGPRPMSLSRILAGDSRSSGCVSSANAENGRFYLGMPARATETQVQLAARFALGRARPVDFAPLYSVDSERFSWVRETAGAVAARFTRALSARPARKTRPRRKARRRQEVSGSIDRRQGALRRLLIGQHLLGFHDIADDLKSAAFIGREFHTALAKRSRPPTPTHHMCAVAEPTETRHQ